MEFQISEINKNVMRNCHVINAENLSAAKNHAADNQIFHWTTLVVADMAGYLLSHKKSRHKWEDNEQA